MYVHKVNIASPKCYTLTRLQLAGGHGWAAAAVGGKVTYRSARSLHFPGMATAFERAPTRDGLIRAPPPLLTGTGGLNLPKICIERSAATQKEYVPHL